MYTIYVIRWPRSSQIYVGRTRNWESRWKKHRKLHPELGTPYYEILESNLAEEESKKAESRWIQFLDSTTKGFNKTLGAGEGETRVNPPELARRSWRDIKVRRS